MAALTLALSSGSRCPASLIICSASSTRRPDAVRVDGVAVEVGFAARRRWRLASAWEAVVSVIAPTSAIAIRPSPWRAIKASGKTRAYYSSPRELRKSEKLREDLFCEHRVGFGEAEARERPVDRAEVVVGGQRRGGRALTYPLKTLANRAKLLSQPTTHREKRH